MHLSGRYLRWHLLVLLVLATAAPMTAQDANMTKLIKKAESGNSEAQYQLGVMYDNGLGVPKDTAEAIRWWRKAAAREHLADADIASIDKSAASRSVVKSASL